MADFISQLSGPEMDNALQEVNAHNAEAWSSGTRGGVQVASGDPTYDNNAKYWASVAKSAVPAGTAAAVLWNQEQQLTDAQKAQARKNISAGGSNPNLLDNPWFTVNQRGATSANNAYGVDRWTGVYTVNNGLKGRLEQYNDVVILDDKIYTLSILLSDGTIYSTSHTLSKLISGWQHNTRFGLIFVGTQFNTIRSCWHAQVNTNDDTRSVKAVKLELGSVSTLANDVAPSYEVELLKGMASKADSSDDFANKPTHPYAISTHKSTQRAWPGNTFIFNDVEPDNAAIYEFIARVSTANGVMLHMYLTIRVGEANTVHFDNVGILQGSATYDTATKTLTITTTQSSHWVYSLHRIVTFV